MTSLRHCHRSRLWVMPRFSTMLENLLTPASLRTLVVFSLPSRYSISSCTESSPDTSWKPALCTPSISTLKLNPSRGSLRFEVAMSIFPPVNVEPAVLTDGASTQALCCFPRHVERARELHVPRHHRGLRAACDVVLGPQLGRGRDPLVRLGRWRRGKRKLLGLLASRPSGGSLDDLVGS